MPDPAEMLAAARLLLETPPQPPSDARLRRAVSTAYYAVFHKISRAAADRFMGQDQRTTAGYGFLYRSFDHARLKKICEDLQNPSLKTSLRRQLGRASMSQPMREFAEAFPAIQDARHAADYDPLFTLSLLDATSMIDQVAGAIEKFDHIDPDEKADVLALMLGRARG